MEKNFFEREDWLVTISRRAEKCRRAYLVSSAIVGIRKLLILIVIILIILEVCSWFSCPERQFAIGVISIVIWIIDAIRELKNKNVMDNGQKSCKDLFDIQDAVQRIVFANKTFLDLKNLNPTLDSTQFSICNPPDANDVFVAAFRVCGFDFPAIIITDTICCKHLKRYINPEDNNYVLVDDLKLEELQHVIINVTFEKNNDPEKCQKLIESGKIYRDFVPICIIDRNIPDAILGQHLG